MCEVVVIVTQRAFEKFALFGHLGDLAAAGCGLLGGLDSFLIGCVLGSEW